MSTRDGIEQTLAAYALGYDDNDFDLLADCFDEDAVLFFPTRDVAIRGREAIRAQLQQQRTDRGGRGEQARHVITNLYVVEESSAEAVVVSFFVVVATDAAGVRVSSGWYRDRLVQQDGRWRFKERTVYSDSKGEATVSPLDPPPIPAA